MAPPILFSTLSAGTEILVTAAVYTFLHQAYYRNRFRTSLLAFALTYEILVNVAYMTYRLINPASGVQHSQAMTNLLAFHGILSLVMLLGLITLAASAIRLHRHGANMFQEMPKTTLTFVILWAISILTGELIYVLTYLT